MVAILCLFCLLHAMYGWSAAESLPRVVDSPRFMQNDLAVSPQCLLASLLLGICQAKLLGGACLCLVGSSVTHTVWQGHNWPSLIELRMTSHERSSEKEASMYCNLVKTLELQL